MDSEKELAAYLNLAETSASAAIFPGNQQRNQRPGEQQEQRETGQRTDQKAFEKKSPCRPETASRT
jgi:hypothetical protein